MSTLSSIASWSSGSFTDVSWYSWAQSAPKNFLGAEFHPNFACLSGPPTLRCLDCSPAIGFSMSDCNSCPCWLSWFLVRDSARDQVIAIAQFLLITAAGACAWSAEHKVSVEARLCLLNRWGSIFRALCTSNVLLRSAVNAYMVQRFGSSLEDDHRLRVKVTVASTTLPWMFDHGRLYLNCSQSTETLREPAALKYCLRKLVRLVVPTPRAATSSFAGPSNLLPSVISCN